jgi:hypothetical protein
VFQQKALLSLQKIAPVLLSVLMFFQRDRPDVLVEDGDTDGVDTAKV